MSLTLGLIKPDAVQSGRAGNILAHLEASGFTVRALQMTRMNTVQAGAFYAVHKERPFFDSLVSFMTSGAVIPMVLEAEDAVVKLRTVIGATDPAEADDGTVRKLKLYAESKERNGVTVWYLCRAHRRVDSLWALTRTKTLYPRSLSSFPSINGSASRRVIGVTVWYLCRAHRRVDSLWALG